MQQQKQRAFQEIKVMWIWPTLLLFAFLFWTYNSTWAETPPNENPPVTGDSSPPNESNDSPSGDSSPNDSDEPNASNDSPPDTLEPLPENETFDGNLEDESFADVLSGDGDPFQFVTPSLEGKLKDALPDLTFERVGDVYKIKVPGSILFDTNLADLKSEKETKLKEIGAILNKSKKRLKVLVVGYTDNTGGEGHNYRLSEDRAINVARILKEGGLDLELSQAIGRGPEAPIAENDTEEGRQKNRRVELELSRK